MPWYCWNIAKVDIKHQSINELIDLRLLIALFSIFAHIFLYIKFVIIYLGYKEQIWKINSATDKI